MAKSIGTPNKTPGEQAAVLALYVLGLKIDTIAELCDCHRSYPSVLARKVGVPPRKTPRALAPDEYDVAALVRWSGEGGRE